MPRAGLHHKTKLPPSGGKQARFAVIPRTEPANRATAALRADHPAVVSGRTMFPSRVFDATERPRVLMSGHHNAKIGQFITKGPWRGFENWTLSLEERATCPRSCASWRECYGNAMPSAVRFKYNPALIAAIERDLRLLAQRFRKGFAVRLHILGDFPDVAYVEHWRRWLDAIPQLHVWGFTAHDLGTPIGQGVARLNFCFPGRVALRFSVAADAAPGPMQAAVTWDKPDGPRAKGGVICPAERGAAGTCGECGLCWWPAAQNLRIVFMGHGMAGGRPPKKERAMRTITAAQPNAAIETLETEEARLVARLAEVRTAIIEARMMFNPARDAIVLRDYPQGIESDEIIRRCHELPGRPIDKPVKLSMRAKELGVRRPDWFVSVVAQRRVASMSAARTRRAVERKAAAQPPSPLRAPAPSPAPRAAEPPPAVKKPMSAHALRVKAGIARAKRRVPPKQLPPQDIEAIERFIRERGVTVCPVATAGEPTTADLPRHDRHLIAEHYERQREAFASGRNAEIAASKAKKAAAAIARFGGRAT